MRVAEIHSRVLLGRGALLHASAISLDGRGILALAPSGGGKSTFAEYMSRSNWTVVSDDVSLVCRSSTGEFLIHPCLLDSASRRLRGHEETTLSAIVFLEKSPVFGFHRINGSYAIYRSSRDFHIWPYLESYRYANDSSDLAVMRTDLARLLSATPSYLLRYYSRDERHRRGTEKALCGT
jgi:hypothetical protein